MSYEVGRPTIDQETLDPERFGMVDGRVVPCRIPIYVLRDLFHAGDTAVDPLDVFQSTESLSRTLRSRVDREGAPAGILDIDDPDFI